MTNCCISSHFMHGQISKQKYWTKAQGPKVSVLPGFHLQNVTQRDLYQLGRDAKWQKSIKWHKLLQIHAKQLQSNTKIYNDYDKGKNSHEMKCERDTKWHLGLLYIFKMEADVRWACTSKRWVSFSGAANSRRKREARRWWRAERWVDMVDPRSSYRLTFIWKNNYKLYLTVYC